MNNYIKERKDAFEFQASNDILLSNEDIKAFKSLADSVYENAEYRWNLIQELITYCLADERAMKLSSQLIPLHVFDESPMRLLNKIKGIYARNPNIEPTALREKFFKNINYPDYKMLDIQKITQRIENMKENDREFWVNSRVEPLIKSLLYYLGAKVYYE